MNAIQLRDNFVRLLDGFRSVKSETASAKSTNVIPFHTLLSTFIELHQRDQSVEQSQAIEDHKRFKSLLSGYGEAFSRYRKQQEETADDFNLLDVLQLTGKETRHSMMLAWLLDHDMRNYGTHAQGNLGFRLFLREFKLPLEYADDEYWVRREVPGDASIVDVEVGCRSRFLIHIENKIWSSEGTDQTDREWADLQRRARQLNIDDANVHALFLTPRGDKATNARFVSISWGRIASVIQRFAAQAKPTDVRLFARHYVEALRKFIVTSDMKEDEDGEATIE